jgi:hypothetical protein
MIPAIIYLKSQEFHVGEKYETDFKMAAHTKRGKKLCPIRLTRIPNCSSDTDNLEVYVLPMSDLLLQSYGANRKRSFSICTHN